jgi:hypothetical protein
MFLTYVFAILITGLIVSFIAYRVTQNRQTTGYITVIAIIFAIFIVKQCVSPPPVPQALESAIKKENTLFALIAAKSPTEFNTYVAQIKKNIAEHGDPNNNTYYTAELVNKVFIYYGPEASNEALYHFLSVYLRYYKSIFQVNPDLVLFLEFPALYKDKTNYAELNKHIDVQLSKELFSAKETVIRSAIDDPQPLITDSERQAAGVLVQEILKTLAKKYGAKVVTAALSHPDKPLMNRKLVASIVISFYEEIFLTGADNTGIILKSLFQVKTN